MKVFVTGHRGMLGHVVSRYLSESGFEVITSDNRYQGLPSDPLIEEIRDSGCEWVINALGKIKQKCDQPDALFRANTLFPLQLKKRLRPAQRLVQASSDCVFSGRAGNYSIDAEHDAEDDYGTSKSLGEYVAEPGRAYVLRTSIIGPEHAAHAGLMGWYLSQKGPVNGFVNHFWNGITTLEWARICAELINSEHSPQQAVCQAGFLPPVTKYQLLQIIGEIWDHAIAIKPCEAPTRVDRSLQPTIMRASIARQLAELKGWYPKAVGLKCLK